MKNKLLLAAMIVLSFLAIGWANQGGRAWEYKTEDKCFDEKRLNEIGAAGWELAGMTESGMGGNVSSIPNLHDHGIRVGTTKLPGPLTIYAIYSVFDIYAGAA